MPTLPTLRINGKTPLRETIMEMGEFWSTLKNDLYSIA